MVANMTKKNKSKRVALTIMGKEEICNRGCYSTQVPHLKIFPENSPMLAITNTIKMGVETQDLPL